LKILSSFFLLSLWYRLFESPSTNIFYIFIGLQQKRLFFRLLLHYYNIAVIWDFH
jgi:hypothetical protein